jgi:putative GTP pyrophosphokinase
LNIVVAGKRASVMADEIETWLIEVLPRHERLSNAVVALLQNTLRHHFIEFLSVTGRSKNLKSALEKIQRKQYSNPKQQLTDLSGIRVVTFLESQVTQSTSLVRKLFQIDEANSLDRSTVLGSDRIGYRSAHFVCTLGKTRESLPEYERLGGLKFEIKIRTALQHAWAELAHDRSFKFGPGLPSQIQRKLNLYSGMLEVVDGAFDAIAVEIDNYGKSIEKKNIKQLSDLEINSITLKEYKKHVSEKYQIQFSEEDFSDTLIEELALFGLKIIGDLERLITDDVIKIYTEIRGTKTLSGFLRTGMILADQERYFGIPLKYKGVRRPFLEALSRNIPIETLLEKYGRLGIVVVN